LGGSNPNCPANGSLATLTELTNLKKENCDYSEKTGMVEKILILILILKFLPLDILLN
jgi:hypothetical protein